MSAEQQVRKEIREAIIFLREKNHTIPSETIEFMKQASLEKVNEPQITIKDVENWMGWLEKRLTINHVERDYIEFALRQIRK